MKLYHHMYFLQECIEFFRQTLASPAARLDMPGQTVIPPPSYSDTVYLDLNSGGLADYRGRTNSGIEYRDRTTGGGFELRDRANSSLQHRNRDSIDAEFPILSNSGVYRQDADTESFYDGHLERTNSGSNQNTRAKVEDSTNDLFCK